MLIHQQVLVGPHALAGDLVVPRAAHGLVVFAHGSGRLSPRDRSVAEMLQARRLGTLLFDLLSETEGRDRANVFDIGLLANRLLQAMSWLRERRDLNGLRVGLFGASTGAAAALRAAAQHASVAAVVSRGGRPDLAGAPALAAVRAPTLLIVGGRDEGVIELNQQACALLQCEKQLEIVPGATHLFEEPGALERAAAHAAAWFARHLGNARA